MLLSERSYSGQLFRPRPEIHVEEGGHLIIIATPWGPRAAAKKTIKVIQDYFLSLQQDEEVTSPFARMTCLSPLANDLRTAVKLANDTIYHEDNKNEYISGVELFVMARGPQEAVWAQIGYPCVFLDRPQRSLVPLGSHLDLAIEYSLGAKTMAPLPNKILGLDPSSDFSIESFRPAQHDRIVLLSRSGTPHDVFKLSAGERNMDQLSRLLSEDDPELPFWIGILELSAA